MWEFDIEQQGNLRIELNINCSTMLESFFDYALLTPTPTSSLDNRLLFVNYTDSTVVFEGQWQDSVPSGGPGKSSGTAGNTMKFPFTGWNVTLLGYFDPTASGNLTLGVSLDEQTQVQLEFEGEGQTSFSNYFEYFTLVQQESDSGNHTITVEVLEASLSQILGFRGFTYIPGFATLNDMPDLSVSISSPVQPSHQGLHGGVIAGIVIGAIAGICLILWGAWWQAKKRRSRSPAQSWMESTSAEVNLGDNVTPFKKGYITVPFTKSYPTSVSLVTARDTVQDQEQPVQDSTAILLPGAEGADLFPVEPNGNNENNGQNGDRIATHQEPDRTELLLQQLNNLMNAIQRPPAYEQEVSP
ncbi:hypothetical protein BDP27DRAFT_1326989 [Rhodocollybia butyracea]|uniref:Uncharacterized protein n=1 Tax=Rhodocollybia butyracea TaxID=206335 RepID=A0A9P5PML6_9AGAR|nr:hypothetical protein BDP27DRAFT_1326989 [Rhodocollybia butyracea]